MNSDIGVIIKQERERQGITRAKLSKNLLSEDNLRALENGEKEEDYFLIKCLAERLGILEKGFSFFLSEKEFEKQNIYEKIEIDILFMNRDEAQDKLAVVYEQLSNSSFLEKVFFYKLALSFENRFNEKKWILLPEIEEYIDIIHKELLNGDILSLVEIDLFIEKIEQNYSFNEKKVLFYELMTYMRHNLKIDYYKSSIWAKISVYYARILLEDKDYWGCIKTCESGLSVTENRKRIVYAPELYSLLGQANNYLGKRSLAKEQFSVSSQLVNSFYKQREYGVIHELLQHYENIDN